MSVHVLCQPHAEASGLRGWWIIHEDSWSPKCDKCQDAAKWSVVVNERQINEVA